jgi:hypothetical protein
MLKKLLPIALLLTTGTCAAKVINFHPGHNSLQAAIDAADAGDVLILQPGSYSDGSAVEVNKTLTLRGASKAAKPVIALNSGNDIILNGTDCNRPISVTIQGIKLLSLDGQVGTNIFAKNCILAFNVLENEFVNSNIAGFAKTVKVIGNNGLNTIVNTLGSELNYIAGNKITGKIVGESSNQSYIVGNTVDCRNASTVGDSNQYEYYEFSHISSKCRSIYNKATTGFVIANKINLNIDTNLDHVNGLQIGIEVDGGNQIISSNLVEFTKLGNLAWINQPDNMSAVWGNTSGVYDIFNNIVNMDGALPKAKSENAAIHYGATSVGHVQNNIIMNATGKAVFSHHPTGNVVQVANNICFKNTTDCGTENGNLTVDPKFVDLVNYQLASDSPAINAGYDALARSDLDKTRADIGIHGGPFGFSQYQAQLQNVTNPFVYPVFDNISATDAESIAVRALAVSRLK